MHRQKHLFLPIIFLIISLFQFSCRKQEKIDPTPGLRLNFSTDTVFFDTVFPTVGSITRRLIVYNGNENKIKVSKISLYGGQLSNYRINIDGVPGLGASDVEIPGNDSIFIFVKVTVDPNNENIPFVVCDSIRFETNGTLQQVKLVAWGRNALFYRDVALKGNVIWDSLRAHVVFGSIRIDTNSSLTILPGTRVYFHKDAYMAVSFQGTLKISGTNDNPVRFQGDRMDPFYKDLPGQWGGIYLEQGSKDNELNYVQIKNGIFGILADQPLTLTSPMLIISNSIIQNMTSTGVYAFGTSIISTNCVIGDCGSACIDLNYGGSYEFRQLTVGNYWYASVRHSPSVYISNYTYDTTGQKISKPLTKAFFGNAIIYGTNDDEIQLDSLPGMPFEYNFDHAIIKTQMSMSNPQRFLNCQANKDPRFVKVQEWNYQIDSISPAIDQGADMGVPFDIRGFARSSPPDLGAYEYVKGRK
ncbi:MAG: choice-of-anchor Q domain-containing protein [Bacteroidota bacterium]